MRFTDHPALQAAAEVASPDGRLRLRPVGDRLEEQQAWVDLDLASMVEGFHGQRLNPPLSEDDRSRAIAGLPPGWEVPPLDPDESFGARYWIVEHQIICGTVLLTPPFPRDATIGVFALYVMPEARGRGLAADTLDLAERAASGAGLMGVQLDALWTWGRALRFYLDRGFWVRRWRHAMHLVRGPVLPRRLVRWEGDRATLSCPVRGEERVLIEAERRGERLGWTLYPNAIQAAGPFLSPLQIEASFALLLATRGWPLLTTEGAWERPRPPTELGGPDALGLHIERMHALAALDGVRIEAPRIPGLPYRDAAALGIT